MSEDITIIDEKEIINRLKIDGDLRMGEGLEKYEIHEGDPVGFYQTSACYLLDKNKKLKAERDDIKQALETMLQLVEKAHPKMLDAIQKFCQILGVQGK